MTCSADSLKSCAVGKVCSFVSPRSNQSLVFFRLDLLSGELILPPVDLRALLCDFILVGDFTLEVEATGTRTGGGRAKASVRSGFSSGWSCGSTSSGIALR